MNFYLASALKRLRKLDGNQANAEGDDIHFGTDENDDNIMDAEEEEKENKELMTKEKDPPKSKRSLLMLPVKKDKPAKSPVKPKSPKKTSKAVNASDDEMDKPEDKPEDIPAQGSPDRIDEEDDFDMSMRTMVETSEKLVYS